MPDLRQQGEIPSQERFTTRSGSTTEQSTWTGQTGQSGQTEERRTMQMVAGGSAIESIGGVATAVLAIIGLSTGGMTSFYCWTIATIVAGAALIVHGLGMAGRLNDMMSSFSQDNSEEMELGTGVTVEVLGGIAGVALGVLALIGIQSGTLVSAAVIVFGVCLLLSSGAVSDMNEIRLSRSSVASSTRRMTRKATVGAAAIQALAGIAVAILGIVAICGIRIDLTMMTGLLVTGCALLVSGGAVSAQMFSFLGGNGSSRVSRA